jgi:hypothetical protein
VAAWFQDMFCNFYLVKNHKAVNNSATTEAREKLSTDLQSSECWETFDAYFLKDLEATKLSLIKLATDFHRQPSNLLGEMSPLNYPANISRSCPS